MNFEESSSKGLKVAKWFGYLLSYALFSTILYFILAIVRHENLAWWQVVLITLVIVLLAKLLHRWLS